MADRERRFSTLLRWLGALAGPHPRCLDLGAGTGAVAERVLSSYPRARVVAVDYDPVTRRLGETALGTARGRLTWVDADLRSPSWTRQLPAGRFDAALSSTALHWLRGAELGRLYRDLARRLRPGGVFLNADSLSYAPDARRVRAAAATLAQRYRERRAPGRPRPAETWAEWWDEIRHDPALAAEVRLRDERFPHEHLGTPTPDLTGHIRRLRAAGFREVELVYSRGSSRVLVAVR